MPPSLCRPPQPCPTLTTPTPVHPPTHAWPVGLPPVEARKEAAAKAGEPEKPKESLVSLLVNDCLK